MNSIDIHKFTSEGDLVELVSPSRKVSIFRLTPGKQLQTHRGIVKHVDLIGMAWGSQVFTHTGSPFVLLQPNLADFLQEIPRNTQIMYPKDIGFVLITMGIGPGSHVIEAGTGSGALTTALAWAVGPQGHVYSYEMRSDTQNLARKNLKCLDLLDRVELRLRDISDGFEERNIDALFLDVPNPHDFMQQVKQALKPGGYFGSILPTTNQVIRLLEALHLFHFSVIDVCELLLRFYRPTPQRIRPTDRMVAHTGYLISGRPIIYNNAHPNTNGTAKEADNQNT
jgi:tRNA (adenine57-N1/adenine58-N1)-methyltransferase